MPRATTPLMPGFAFDLFEDQPAGLIGVQVFRLALVSQAMLVDGSR
ncbi:MAG: hypothetical protein HY023_15755 [Chloroflexi bacterium]|nr:hypothetical protein [Chloroflexota bacterium]